jgi:hypothetical protein
MQSEAMLRSGARSRPATMQSKEAMWGHLPLAGERSGANEHRDVSDTSNFQR